MNEPKAAPLAGLDEMNRLIDGYQSTTLVYAALKLGLPERMGAAACTAERLAAATGAPPDRVLRLLRALAAIGVCEELPDSSFALSAAGQQLRADAGSGMREKAILAVEHYWPAWAAFEHCVTREQTAFAAAFGMTAWEYRRDNPHLGATFNTWLAAETHANCASLVAALDVTHTARVADIGGGNGGLLRALLRAHPHLTGVLFDQPHVVGQAAATFGEEFRNGRLQFAGGDFFADIPVQAELYLLKSVLHDWNDADTTRILRNCRAAMAPDARLALIERVLPARAAQAPATIMVDVQMMAITGGRERGLGEFERLLQHAGLALRGVTHTAAGFAIIEAVAA
jgi:hypothetical protein